MREKLNLKKDIQFKNNIAEVSSISLECEYDVKGNSISGNFLLEGSYRTYDISIDKEDFDYTLPFTYEFKEKILENSGLVNVKDFTYTIDKDTICIDVEYEVLADKDNTVEFEDKEEFDRFIQEKEIDIDDIISLGINDPIEEEVKEDEIIPEEVEERELEPEIVETVIIPESDHITEEETERISTSIIEDINNREDTYITYHIHVCDDTDSLDSIARQYNISAEIIKNYNFIDNVTVGMKIIIPEINE